jgi:methylated-DNA-protein-cysteine methyltransferase-like protein
LGLQQASSASLVEEQEMKRSIEERSALPFPQRVALVVSAIPYGHVTTYGRIAAALGSPKSARMVGWAMSAMPAGHDLPAHRVVNRLGVLSGAEAFGHPGIMRDLLLEEEVPFRDEWTVDLAECLWDPLDDPSLADLFRPGSPLPPVAGG